MTLALELAENGAATTSPNPMVGAVVVRDGRVVGRGWHERAGMPHAEVNAIEDAGPLARGADLYVTLEPCNHTGRTPPCTDAVLRAGIRRVYSAMGDPNPGVAGGGHRRLAAAGVAVTTGLLEERARRLNGAFITHCRTGRPRVLLKVAATLDGRIATRTGDSRWVTNPLSRAFVHELRHRCDAILVGVGTVAADDPSLTTRLPAGGGVDPMRIVLDTRLSIPVGSRILHQRSDAPTLIVTGPGVDPERHRAVAATGARVLEAETDARGIDLHGLLDRLGAMKVTSLLVEGGGRVAASALASGVVDRLYLFLAPKLLGGDDGVPVFTGPGPGRMADCLPLEGLEIRRFGEDLLVEGDPPKRPTRR